MLIKLRLDETHERHLALTPAIAECFREAASVCLSRHNNSPCELTIADNGSEQLGEVRWVAPSSRELGAWANDTERTEKGACICIIAGVEQLRGFFAVRRAETGTGADYYVGPKGTGQEDLEKCFRLEISGLDKGSDDDVKNRLSEKIRQLEKGKSNLPALAGVIGFRARLLLLRDVLSGAM